MTQEPSFGSTEKIKSGPKSVIFAALYPLQALGLLIVSARLRRYVLMPILLNLFLGITLYAGLLLAGFQAIDAIIAAIPQWLAEVPGWSGSLPHLPQWNAGLPEWTAHLFDWTANLPHWRISLPHWTTHLLDWTVNLPHWHVSLPQWTPNLPEWHISLPNFTFPNWIADLPNWGLLILIGVIRVLLVVVLLLVTGFVLLQFGVFLGSPWYGKLSEELEKMQTGQLHTIEVGPVQELGRAIQYELKKLILSIGIGLPLLLLNFFPGVGTAIVTSCGIALAATIVCLDFLDSALERRRLRFRQKLGIIRRSLPASAVFGLVCLGLVSIPLLNLLAIPVCVTAGTLFFCDQIFPWLEPAKRD